VQWQRSFYTKNNISIDRINRLESIGFVWAKGQEKKKWNEMYQKLVAYKKEHKSTNVPRGYARDPKLGNWVHVQHPLYKSKNLNTERMNKLESLGSVWGHSFDTQWTENFLRLVAYKKKHNSTNVPNRYAEDDHPLGNWVSSQRTFYKTKLLSIDRINHLESIGFVLDVYDAQWMECFHKLVSYNKKHNSTLTSILLGQRIVLLPQMLMPLLPTPILPTQRLQKKSNQRQDHIIQNQEDQEDHTRRKERQQKQLIKQLQQQQYKHNK
jgi:hypothetical protein